MTEAQRWLRYLLPGSVGEALFGLWLFIDGQTCACYPVPPLTAVSGALIVALSLPFGFIAAQVASEMAWRKPLSFVFRLTRVGNERLLAELGLAEHDEKTRAAKVDVRLHLVGGREGNTNALARARSLIDLMQALGNAAAAAWLALPGIWVFILATRLVGSSDLISGERLVIAGLASVASAAVGFGFASSHRRVADIAEEYVSEFFALAK